MSAAVDCSLLGFSVGVVLVIVACPLESDGAACGLDSVSVDCDDEGIIYLDSGGAGRIVVECGGKAGA